jgi:single-strand DNA-binding protein
MTVQGNLGKDPESHIFQPSGKIKVELSVATNSKWRNNEGQEVRTTEWHTIVLWGKQAEVANKYLKKGDTVCVTGPIETRNWEKDGVKYSKKEIRAREFAFSSKSKSTDSAPEDDNSGYMEEPAI